MSLLLVDSAAAEQSVIPDGLRLVRFVAPHHEAARPVPLVDLTTAERKLSEGGGVSLVPAERDRGNIRLDVPWAGEVPTVDRHGNARLSFTLRLLAGDPVADADNVVGAIVAAPGRAAIEWRRGGRATYYPLRGDADWTPTYRMRERMQGAGMLAAFSVEVAPYAHRGSMDVADDFDVDSLGDYTFDVGEGTLQVLSGQMVPADTTEKRLHHTARDFTYADHQATVKIRTGASITGAIWRMGVILKRKDAQNYIYITIGDETGDAATPAPRLRVVIVTGGVATSVVSNTATLATNTNYWLRGRIEGNVVIPELFTAEPSPMGSPAQASTHTLTGVDATNFGTGVVGRAGIYALPRGTDYRIDDFRVRPFTYRNLTLPRSVAMSGAIPGNLPALCDLSVTTSGGTDAPVFGLIGWALRPGAARYGVAPLGVIEAEAANTLSGFSVEANAGSLSGNRIITPAATGAGSATAAWTVDAGALSQDDVTVDVFARVSQGAGFSGLKWVLDATPLAGGSAGATRYSDRGSAGLGSLVNVGPWQFVRLGRIRLSGPHSLRLVASWSGGNNVLLVDYLVLVPAHAFVASPMDVANDAAYPKFVPGTAERTRTLLHDGGGVLGVPGQPALREHGLGRRLELPVGKVDLVAKLSSLVVGDPVANAASEQLTHAATLHASITPRFAYA